MQYVRCACYTCTYSVVLVQNPNILCQMGFNKFRAFLCFEWCSKRWDFVPYLFIVYIDDLRNMLNSAGIGCHIHNCCTNHLFYADDICVIAPSPSGLQGLLNIYAKFGLENDVEYNPIKSLCMVFKPRGFNMKCPDIYM